MNRGGRVGVVAAMATGLALGWACGGVGGGPDDAGAQDGGPGEWQSVECSSYTFTRISGDVNSRNVRTEYRALLELDPSTHQVERCVDEVLGSVDAYLDGCGVESEECSTDVPETTCVYESPVRAAGDDALVYCGYSQQAEERADSESPWVETGDPSGIRYTVRIRRVL